MAQVVRQKTIGASYGDAFLAALAMGDVEPGDIDRWNPVASDVPPDPANADVYARQYRVFRELYQQTRAQMAELGAEG